MKFFDMKTSGKALWMAGWLMVGQAFSQSPLGLVESPAASGFYSNMVNDSLAGIGVANAKTWLVELEGGDRVTIWAVMSAVNSNPRLRFFNAGGTLQASSNGNTQGEAMIQSFTVTTPGSYMIQFYADSVASNFQMRVDMGRGFALEMEPNDSRYTSSLPTLTPTGGGFTTKAAGALKDGADYYDLGSLAAGNAVNVSLGLPTQSTLVPGDVEMTLFEKGSEATPLAVTTSTVLNQAIPSTGEYLLRLRVDEALSGHALRFDGSNDDVALGNSNELRITGDQTLEMWIKPDDFGGRRNPWNKAYGGEGTMTIETDGGINYFYGTSGNDTTPYQTFFSNKVLSAGEWTHIALVRRLNSEPRKLFWYFNGRLVNEANATYFPAVASALNAIIGSGYAGRFRGLMDEVRVWNVARSGAEIAANMDHELVGNEAGLAAYYKFEEGAGAVLGDATANGLNGTIGGGAEWAGTAGVGTFSAARAGLMAQYVASVTVTDAAAPSVVKVTPLPVFGHTFEGAPDLIMNPGNMTAYRGQNGTSFHVQVTGGGGSVWGTEVYSDDSALSAAVRHAGLLASGETGLVTVTVAPGQSSYTGSPQNGVSSTNKASHPGSYSLSAYSGPTPTLNAVYGGVRVDFTERMLASTLQNTANVVLTHAGADGVFDTADDHVHTTSSSYDGLSATAYLTVVNEPLQPGQHRLRVTTGAQDRAGNSLVADSDSFFTVVPKAPFVIENRDNGSRAKSTPLNDVLAGVFDRSFFHIHDISIGVGPQSMRLLDLDGDGIKDAIVAAYGQNQLRVHKGNADGSFATTGTSYATGTNPWTLQLLDFDADGLLDVVVSCYSSDQIRLHKNQGDGTLAAAGSVSVGDGPLHMAMADFNGDGVTDIAVANYLTGVGGRSISILLADGMGGFIESKVTVAGASFRPYGLAAGDVNGDGDVDLVAGDFDSDKLMVFLGAGDGSFGLPASLDMEGVNPTAVRLADFDQDGNLDIMVAAETSSSVAVLKGNGDGTFMPYVALPLGTSATQYYADVVDVDGDGWTDILMPRSNGLVVMYNNRSSAAPAFTAPFLYQMGNVYGAVVADVNGDSLPDLVLNEWGSSRLRVLRGNARTPLTPDPVLPRLHTAHGRGRVLDSADSDWFSFTLDGPKRVVLAADVPLNPGSASGLQYQMYDPDGNSLTILNLGSGGVGQTGQINLNAPGTYYARVSHNHSYTGEYRFRISAYDLPVTIETEANNNIAQANTVGLTLGVGALGGAAVGYISSSDSSGDYWSLGNLGAGAMITLDLRIPQSSPLSARMALFKADGTQVAMTEAGDAQLQFEVTEGNESTYVFRVFDAANTRGLHSEYLVDATISDPAPPFVTASNLPAEGASATHVSPNFTVTFSEDMLASTVINNSNYDLRATGPDGVFGTVDDDVYTVTPQAYSAGLTASFHIPNGPLQPGSYRFTAGTGLTDIFANPLASVFTRQFSVEGVSGFVLESRSNETLATADSISVSPSPVHDSTFSHQEFLSIGNGPWGVKLLDLDEDGILDAVVAMHNEAQIAVFRGNGDGTFGTAVNYASGANPWDIELVDVNDDGRLDVVVSCYGSDQVRIYNNPGDGTLTEGPVISVGDGPVHMVKGNFNGDALTDLAVVNHLTGTGGRSVSLLLGNGTGSFSESKITVSGQTVQFYALAVGDLDGDGLDDLVAGDWVSNSMASFLNTGVGFAAPVFHAISGTNPAGAVLADFDGDGHLDLAVTNQSSSSVVSLLAGNGDGTFKPFTTLSVDGSTSSYYVEAPDLNGDGRPDLLVSRYNGIVTRLNANLGTMDFMPLSRHSESSNTGGIDWGDVNGDGRLDLVAASFNNNRLHVWTGNETKSLTQDAVVAGLRYGGLRGHLTTNTDVDWYSFSAIAGDRLMLNTETPSGAANSGRNYNLFNSTGVSLGSFNAPSSGTVEWSTILEQTGTYYLRVAQNFGGTAEYRVRLVLARPPVFVESESNNSVSQFNTPPYTLSAGQLSATVMGVTMTSDSQGDFFSLGNLTPDTVVTVTARVPQLTVENLSTPEPTLTLLKSDGTQMAQALPGAGPLQFTLGGGDAGAYRLRVSRTERSSAAVYLADLLIEDVTPPLITTNSLPAEGSTSTFPPPTFTLGFSEDMLASSVTNVANYELRHAGPNGVFDDADDSVYALQTGSYTSGLSMTMRILDGPLQPGAHRFTAGPALLDLFERPMTSPHQRSFMIEAVNGFVTEGRDNNTVATAENLAGMPEMLLADGSYALPSGISTGGTTPYSLLLMDLDGDGAQDAVVSNYGSNHVSTLKGNGDGTFQAAVTYAVGNGPSYMAALDFDKDGLVDVVVPNYNTDNVTLLRNLGDGTFSVYATLAAGDGPLSAAAGDFNGDGNPDFAVSNHNTGALGRRLSVFLGDGLGGFTHAFIGVGLTPVWRPYHLAVADFDGNGLSDLAATSQDGSDVLVFLATGGGAFAEPVRQSTDRTFGTGIAAADFNGDFQRDLLVGYNSYSQLNILRGNGDGTFQPFENLALSATRTQFQLRAADLNGDGYPDLLAPRWGALEIFQNRAAPGLGFFSPVIHTNSGDVIDAAVADLNGDGRRDIVALSQSLGELRVYMAQGSLNLAADSVVPGMRNGYGRGQLDTNTDVDYFMFSARGGERLIISADTNGANNSGFSYNLYDHRNTNLLNTSNTSANGAAYTQPFVLPYDGRYYVRVSPNFYSATEYRFRVTVVDAQTQIESEANNSIGAANSINFSAAGGSRTAKIFGHIASNDTSGDFWGLGNLASGTQIQVTLNRPDNSTFSTGTLRLLNSSGTEVATSGAGGLQVLHTVVGGAEGAYFLHVSESAANRNLHCIYQAAVSLTDALPPQITGTNLPAEGSSTLAFINSFTLSFNEDLMASTVTQAANYMLREAGPDLVLGTSDDVIIPITPGAYSSGSSASYGLGAPLTPGGYRLTVTGLRDTYGNNMTSAFVRNFTVSELPGFTTAGTGVTSSATATPMVQIEDPAGLVTGAGRGRRISTSDTHWWTFDGTAGQVLMLDCELVGAAATQDLTWTLRRPDNSVLWQGQKGNNDIGAFIPVTLNVTGTYRLSITQHDSWLQEYRFRLTLANPALLTYEAEANNTIANATSLTLVESGGVGVARAAGIIHTTGDLDYFALGTVAAGKTIFVSATLPATSSFLPVVAVYNSSGVFMNEINGTPGDGSAEVRINTPGDYFMLVRSTGATGNYMSQYVAEVQVHDTSTVAIPNLQVTEVKLPPEMGLQSGDTFTYEFTVTNVGSADIPNGSWSDRLVLSKNLIFGDEDDTEVGVFVRNGGLQMGAFYTVSGTSVLPQGAVGDYYLIARADFTNQVDEVILENDNTSASTATFPVALAPYPDLVVQNLGVTGPVANEFTISWDLANTGNLEAPAGFKERVRVVNTTTGATLLDEMRTPGAMAPAVSLPRTATVSTTTAGVYQVSVTADAQNEVYEHDGVSNITAEVNTAQASFTILQYWTVNVSTPDPARGAVSGGGTFLAGTPVTVTATADTSLLPWQFVRWTQNGSFVSASASYSFNAAADRNLVAEFALPSYQVSATVTPAGAGSVSGTSFFQHGSNAQLTATPSQGYLFGHWLEGGSNIGTEAVLNVAVTGPRIFQAVFVEANPTHDVVTATNPPGLGVTTGDGTFNNGQSSNFSATASVEVGDTEYLFDHWKLNGVFFGSQRVFSKAFSTLDAPVMNFVAHYTSRSLKPVVTQVTSNYANPIRAAGNVSFTLTFDRPMRGDVNPGLLLSSMNATETAVIPAGGVWISSTQFRSADTTFGEGNGGAYVLSASAATDVNNRIMEPADVFSFDVDVTPPLNPVLALSSFTSTSATVNWTGYAEPTDLNAFRMYLQTADFASVVGIPAVSGLGSAPRSYTFTNLQPDTPYYAAITAVDVAGNSNPNVTTLPILIQSTIPSPVNFVLTSPSSESAHLNWNAYPTAALIGFQGWRVYMQEAPFADVTGLTPVAQLAANVKTHLLTGLDRTKIYHIAVVGYNRLDEFNPAVTPQVWSDPLAGQITANLTIGAVNENLTVEVLQSMVVKPGATLTVLPGTTLKFAPGTALTIEGALVAEGTVLRPINFISNAATPAKGDWNGVVLSSTTNSTRLSQLWVRHGRGVQVIGGTPLISSLFCALNEGQGLAASGNANVSVSGCFFAFNDCGVRASDTATLLVGSSVIKNNSQHGAERTGSALLNMQENWWGSSVAGEISAMVSGTVNTSSPLAGEPVLATGIATVGGITNTGVRDLSFVLASANATAFRLSENSLFPGVLWQDIFATGETNTFSPYPFSGSHQLSAGAGLKTVYAQFRSITGQTSAAIPVNVTLITTGPIINAFSLTDGQVITRPLAITGSATAALGMNFVRLYANETLLANSAGGSLNFQWDMRALNAGPYRMVLLARDNAGNESTREVNVTLDPQPPPVPVITVPVNNAIVATPTISVSGMAEPGVTVRLTRNSAPQGSTTATIGGTFSFANVPLVEGGNALVATAEDVVGTRASTAVNVELDSGPPSAVVLIEPPIYDAFRGLMLQWGFSPAGERPVKYRVFWHNAPFADSATASGQSPLLNVQSYTLSSAPDGDLYISVVGYDAANNASPLSNQIAYTLDRTAPVFAVSYDKPMPAGPGPLTIVLESNEPLAATPLMTIKPNGLNTPISVPLTKTSGTTYTATYNVTNISARTGAAIVNVTGTDLTGNRFSGSPGGTALSFDVTPPTAALTFDRPVPIKTVSDADPTVPEDVNLSFNLTLSEAPKPGTTPSLTFTPPIGADLVPVLTGAGVNWTGSILLTSAMGRGQGQFVFTATDARDNVGTSVNPNQLEIYNTEHPNAPGIPVNLAATTLSGGRIKITWNAVSGAHSYRIYREPGNTGVTPVVLVADGIEGTEWIDETVPEDGIYRYAIRAFRVSIEGNPSGTLNALSDRTPPNAPENLEVTLTQSGLLISWSPPSEGLAPHRYHVYRNGVKIRTVSSSQPVLDFPPKGLLQYEVAAADSYENESRTGPVPFEFFVDAVGSLLAQVNQGQPTVLSWTFNDPAGVGYNVYRNGIKQNGQLIAVGTKAFTDLLPLPRNESVEYRVTAVDNLSREGAPRTVRVLPVSWSLLMNPDEEDTARVSRTRYFENYRLTLLNRDAAVPVNFDSVQISRTLSAGAVTAFTQQVSLEIPPSENDSLDIPVPGPQFAEQSQNIEISVRTVPNEGGSVVAYTGGAANILAAVEPLLMLEMRVVEPPVAGGLAEVKTRIHNRGYTTMEVVLGRQTGQQPGDLFIQVLDESGAEISRREFNGFGAPGLVIRPNGDAYVTIEPGASVEVDVDEVLIPSVLAEMGRANFRATVSQVFSGFGTANQRVSGPLTGTLQSTVIETPYYGAVTTEKDTYSGDEPIVISGQAIDRASSNPQGSVPMRIGFAARGAVWYQDVESDADGNFSYSYTPFSGFAGELTIWAAHPDVFDVLAQKTVRIYRIYATPSFGNIRMSKNDHLDFTIQLFNPATLPLSGTDISFRAYRLDVDGVTEIPVPEVTCAFQDGGNPGTLAPSKRTPLKLRLAATVDAPDNANIEITFMTAEGATTKFVGTLQLLPAVPILSMTSPRQGFVDVTVSKGKIISQQVTVQNLGTRPLLDVVLVPPKIIPWIQVNLPVNAEGNVELPDIEVGDTITFTVAFVPPDDTPQGYVQDVVKVRGSNAMAGFDFNIYALVSSEEKGDVAFHVENFLGQNVPNATVRLRNSITGQEAGPLTTDANGDVTFANLTEGLYSWQTNASGHSTAMGIVDVVAAQTVIVEPVMQRSLVTVTFQVRPVPFTDRYEIVIEQTFETFVPAPVLVMTPPKYDFANVRPGFETTVIYELKNHGLIKVFDVDVTGTLAGMLTIEPLIDFIPELLPQQKVQIPCRIRLGHNLTDSEAGGDYTIGGAAPTIGSVIGGFCESPNLADFLNGIAAIAALGANGDFQSQSSGSLGTAAAVALAAAAVYETVGGGVYKSLADVAMEVAAALGQCAAASMSASGGGGGGGGGGPPPRGGGGGGAGGNGCFTGDTPVLLSNGHQKQIQDIRPGDELATGPDLREMAKVGQLYTLESDELLLMSLRAKDQPGALTREMRITGEHMVWRDGTGWVPARDLRPGDWLHDREGGMIEVVSARPVPGTHKVYTLQLKGGSTFYAGGVLVQDLCGGLYLEPAVLSKLEPVTK